jgi:cholesterol oxidase
MDGYDHDVIVVGSGFGGSVAALRLTEKGYRVGVLEMGRRYGPDDLPRSTRQVNRYFWRPNLGMRGLLRYTRLDDILVLSAVGVGGGSLIYACTLFEPLDSFYDDPQWRHIADWRSELAPYFDQAKRMLGATTTPFDTPADAVFREVSRRMGVEETHRKVPVGVYFGEPGVEVSDPYFGGAGPARTGCIGCAACVVGCRHGAKNTLDHNYLHLAESNGATIIPDRRVLEIAPMVGGGYRVASVRPGARASRDLRVHTAEQVVLSAGVIGTLEILLTSQEKGRLTGLSPTLGSLFRSNSEAVLGVTATQRDVDYAQGTAITSSFHPDPDTTIQCVRYPAGSDVVGLNTTILVDGRDGQPRQLGFVRGIGADPIGFLRSLSLRHWAERTVIMLVMQSLDNSLRVYAQRTRSGIVLRTERGHGEPNPTWIPAGHAATRHAADVMDGVPLGGWADVLYNVPRTAHPLGGATMGDSPETGVVDPYHRVYGHPGLHVVDASAITANIGANPALTIAAVSERALAYWPNRGQEDPRPPAGAEFREVRPVAPERPAVPTSAPAAYRLPVVPA